MTHVMYDTTEWRAAREEHRAALAFYSEVSTAGDTEETRARHDYAVARLQAARSRLIAARYEGTTPLNVPHKTARKIDWWSIGVVVASVAAIILAIR